MRNIIHALIAAFLFLAAATAASAQARFQMVGPNECLNCHDHDAERQWYEKKEIPEVQRLFPDKGANAGHINSLKQLEAAKSNDFAKAIGLADKYDLKGACVQCHATVFAGDANAGVSCESCHGPASGYLKPHQTKGTYEQSVAQYGMTKLVGNLQGWTQQCTNCHVMDDERLIKAGHPSGDDFDLAKKFQPVSLHFKKMYSAIDIGAIAKAELEGIIRRRRPNAAPPAAAPAVAAAPVPAEAPAPAPAPPAEPVAQQPPAAVPEAPPPAPAAAVPAAIIARVAPPANLAAPQAGSPTSIEPPPPIEAVPVTAAPQPPAALPAATPAVTTLPVESSGTSPLVWALVGGLVVVVIGLVVLLRGKKS